MAASFPPTVTAVSAVQVGNFFVGQYYQVLQQQPEFVHQFYTDLSRVTRIDGTEVETSVGMLKIHSLVMSLNFTSIEIKNAHSMDSWSGGVLVAVSGSVQIKEYNSTRKFAQSFFLAPQDNGYFILNDIFQLFEEDQPLQHSTLMLDHGNYDPNLNIQSYDTNQTMPSYDTNPNMPSNPDSVTEYAMENDVHGDEYAPIVYQETEAVDKYSIPEPTPEISEVETRIEEEVQVEETSPSYSSSLPVNTARDPPSAPVEETFEEPVKHTYASILRSKTHPVAPVGLSSLSKSSTTVSEWDQPTQQSQSAPVQYYPQQSMQPEKSNVGTDETSAFDDEGEVTSVYVRNLPPSASASELEQEFRNFGKLKPDGVLIKSRKEAGIYYAFVEFEDLSGVHNAVKASPLLYQGRQIFVEERRPNSGASRGRRGRGRGSYPFETTRGGWGFGVRTYGRPSGQENVRDYNSRARGNGVHQPRTTPRQERGILGSQGMKNGSSQYEGTS